MAFTTKNTEFKRVLASFDEDGDGKISPAELRLLVQTIGEELSLEEAEKLSLGSDTNGDGLLEFDDFLRLLGAEDAKEDSERALRAAFAMFVMDGEGCITPESLKLMLSRLGTLKDIDECRAMICRFDLNGDGVLSFDEFKAMMKH